MSAADSEVVQAAVEFARFFSMKHRGIVSLRSDGTIHIQRLGHSGFVRYLRKKDNVPLDQWIAAKQAEIRGIPSWCFEVAELPTMEELEEWASDSIVDTPTGYSVEPDGCGPDGVPSWLRCLGLI